jgi:hypothetical protein
MTEEIIKPLKKIKKEAEILKKELKRKTLELVLAAFTFEAIFPQRKALMGKFFYALVVTFIIVFLSHQLNKILSEENENKN